MKWFLYKRNLRHERVKSIFLTVFAMLRLQELCFFYFAQAPGQAMNREIFLHMINPFTTNVSLIYLHSNSIYWFLYERDIGR